MRSLEAVDRLRVSTQGGKWWLILFHLTLTEAERVEGVPEHQRPKGKLSGASREPAASKVREWPVGQQTGLENFMKDGPEGQVSVLNMSGLESQNQVHKSCQ